MCGVNYVMHRKVALNVSLKGLPAALAARDDQAAQ
jgi:hypothetical protein